MRWVDSDEGKEGCVEMLVLETFCFAKTRVMTKQALALMHRNEGKNLVSHGKGNMHESTSVGSLDDYHDR